MRNELVTMSVFNVHHKMVTMVLFTLVASILTLGERFA